MQLPGCWLHGQRRPAGYSCHTSVEPASLAPPQHPASCPVAPWSEWCLGWGSQPPSDPSRPRLSWDEAEGSVTCVFCWVGRSPSDGCSVGWRLLETPVTILWLMFPYEKRPPHPPRPGLGRGEARVAHVLAEAFGRVASLV